MNQMTPRTCPRCHAPAPPGQRFCSNCGATIDASAVNPTDLTPSGESYGMTHDMSTQASTAPPPPVGPAAYGAQATPPPYTSYTPQPPQNYPQAGNMVAPQFTQPQKDSSGSVLRQLGCGVGVVILLVVLVCGVSGFIGYKWISGQLNNSSSNSSTNSNSNSNGSNPGNSTTPAARVTTTQLNSPTVTYRSAELTLLTVQQSSSFPDDENGSSGNIVRINMKEHNPSTASVYFSFNDSARLILPDKTSIAPNTYSNNASSIAQSVTLTGAWIDFPTNAPVQVDQLTLQLGGDTEAQMQVPLTGKADLSQYQTKTVSPNTKIQYAGLSWTVTSATRSWSLNGNQAGKGMRFVTLSMSVDNPTGNGFTKYWGNYIRLQAGDTTIAPNSDTNFPTSFDADSSNTTGTLFFAVPQNVTSYTLIFLNDATASPPVSQATGVIQIP